MSIRSWINLKQGKIIDPRVPGTNSVLLPKDIVIDTLSVNINGIEMQLGLDYDTSDSLIIFYTKLHEHNVVRLSWVAK